MVKRWDGGVGSVNQASGLERRAMGDKSERGLEPEVPRVRFVRRPGSRMQVPNTWGGDRRGLLSWMEKGTMQC